MDAHLTESIIVKAIRQIIADGQMLLSRASTAGIGLDTEGSEKLNIWSKENSDHMLTGLPISLSMAKRRQKHLRRKKMR